MSRVQLESFLEAVKTDAGLQEQLKAAGDDDAVVAIAKAAGFAISVEELSAELTEEELENITGGALPFIIKKAVKHHVKNYYVDQLRTGMGI